MTLAKPLYFRTLSLRALCSAVCSALCLMFLLGLTTTSCGGPHYVDFFPVYDDGSPKPQVVLMPIKIPESCPESLAKDLISDIRYVAMDRGDLYLFPDSDVRAWRTKNSQVDIFDRNLTWTRDFHAAEFIALIEAIELNPYTYPCGCEMPFVLIKLRLKVIDIRCSEPRLILHEVLETCQRVYCPVKGTKTNEDRTKTDYRLLVDKVVRRLETVIWNHN